MSEALVTARRDTAPSAKLRAGARRYFRNALAIVALTLTACNTVPRNVARNATPAATVTLIAAPTPTPQIVPVISMAVAKWQRRGWDVLASGVHVAVLADHAHGVLAVRQNQGAVVWRNETICKGVDVARIIAGQLFIGCRFGTIAVLDKDDGHVLRSTRLSVYGVNEIMPAGDTAIAVAGWNDGAALRSDLNFLSSATLQKINKNSMTDSTFLGVIGKRAYIDDWCCNGRGDSYRPATIYPISLADGSETARVDLAPDAQHYLGQPPPVGQGSHNYLIGHALYVPVGVLTYRYDILHLDLAPTRMR